MFPLMSTEGVLGAAWLPTDGYLDPSQLTYALADGARRGGCRDLHQHAGHRDRGRAAAGCAAVETEQAAGSRPRSWSTPAACSPPRSGGWPASACRSSRCRTSTWSPSRSASRAGSERAADAARPRPARSTSARRAAGWSWAATSAAATGLPARRHRRLRRDPARLQRPPARGGLGPLRGDHRELAASACRRWTRSRSRSLINGPEAFTPDNEFCLGETEVAGFFVAAGFCAHGLAGAGGIGKVMAEWIVEGEPSLDLWHMDVRRFGAAVPLARLHATRGPARPTRPTTTSATRATSARPGGRCASRPPTPGTASTAPRSARSRAGSGSTGTSRNAADGRRVAAPARLGRAALVAGDRRRAPRRARERRRSSTSPRSRSSRSPGRAPPRFARAPLRQPRRARRRARSPTPRCSTAAAGSSATSPSPASARSASRSSPAPRSATTTASGSAATCPRTARSRVARRHLGVGLLRALGPAARATSSRR